MSAENIPSKLLPPPHPEEADVERFLDGVRLLAEQNRIVSCLIGFAIDVGAGKVRMYSDAIGSEKWHAELGAQAYSTHVLPITKRAENLARIASTPAQKEKP